MHLTVGMFGDNEFFARFGKQGTANDLIIRNQADSNNVITYVAPNSDKVQPLIQAAAMSDYPVVVVNELNPAMGEVFVLLDETGFQNGLVITDFLEDRIRALIKDMSISGFDFARKDENAAREKILSVRADRQAEPAIVTIDNYFPVKGVGTVVLGMVKSGIIRQYDRLFAYPQKKEVLVKSMQSQDKDVKETEPGQRVGLALKGVEPEEIRRGCVLSDKETRCSKVIDIDAAKSKYSRYEFAAGKKLMVGIGLQVISGEIKNVSDAGKNIRVELDNPAALYSDKCILAAPDTTPRIVGHGRIA